jgi:hypothetical protein
MRDEVTGGWRKLHNEDFDNIKMDLKKRGCGLVTCSCEHGNEPLGSIKDAEFLDKLNSYQLLKDCSMELFNTFKSDI